MIFNKQPQGLQVKNYFSSRDNNSFEESTYPSSPHQSTLSKDGSQESLQDPADFILEPSELEVLNKLAVSLKRDWAKITKKFQNLCNKDISQQALQERYKASQTFKLRGVAFTQEEDQKLIEIEDDDGIDWLMISKEFPERCPISLRNRYYKIKKISTGKSKQKSSLKHEKLKLKKKLIKNKVALDTLVKDIELSECPEFLHFIDSMLQNPLSDMSVSKKVLI